MQRAIVLLVGLLFASSVFAKGGERGAIGLGLVLNGRFIGSGAEVSGNFGDHVGFSLAYIRRDFDFQAALDDSAMIEVTNASASLVHALATLRFYPMGGSFNLGLTAGQREFAIDIGQRDRASGETLDVELTGTTILGGASIGNTWRWSHFYFGFDWIGYYAPLSHKAAVTSKTTSGSTNLSAFNDDILETGKMIADSPTSTLLVFSIGFQI